MTSAEEETSPREWRRGRIAAADKQGKLATTCNATTILKSGEAREMDKYGEIGEAFNGGILKAVQGAFGA